MCLLPTCLPAFPVFLLRAAVFCWLLCTDIPTGARGGGTREGCGGRQEAPEQAGRHQEATGNGGKKFHRGKKTEFIEGIRRIRFCYVSSWPVWSAVPDKCLLFAACIETATCTSDFGVFGVCAGVRFSVPSLEWRAQPPSRLSLPLRPPAYLPPGGAKRSFCFYSGRACHLPIPTLPAYPLSSAPQPPPSGAPNIGPNTRRRVRVALPHSSVPRVMRCRRPWTKGETPRGGGGSAVPVGSLGSFALWARVSLPLLACFVAGRAARQGHGTRSLRWEKSGAPGTLVGFEEPVSPYRQRLPTGTCQTRQEGTHRPHARLHRFGRGGVLP